MNKYSFEEAQNEAEKIKDLVGQRGKKEDYETAEKLIDEELKQEEPSPEDSKEKQNEQKKEEPVSGANIEKPEKEQFFVNRTGTVEKIFHGDRSSKVNYPSYLFRVHEESKEKDSKIFVYIKPEEYEKTGFPYPEEGKKLEITIPLVQIGFRGNIVKFGSPERYGFKLLTENLKAELEQRQQGSFEESYSRRPRLEPYPPISRTGGYFLMDVAAGKDWAHDHDFYTEPSPILSPEEKAEMENLEKIAKEKSNDFTVNLELADFYRRKGKGREAEAVLLQTISKEIDPSLQNKRDVFGYTAMANLYISQGRYEEAEECLEKVLKIEPNNTRVFHSFGQMEKRRRNPDKAEEYFKKILEIEPENIYAFHGLGKVFKERGNWRESKKYLEKAFHLDPNNVPVLNTFGELYEEMGNWEAAIQNFDKALSIDQDNQNVLVSRAVLKGKMGDFQGAEEDFKKVQELNEKNLYMSFAWADMELLRKNIQRAEEIINDVRRKFSRDWFVKIPQHILHNILGKISAVKIDYDHKKSRHWRRHLEESMEKSPDNPITYNNFAQIEILAGEIDEAEKLLKRSLDCDPKNAYTNEIYGEMLLNIPERQEEAKRYLSQAQELGMEKFKQ